MSNGDPQGSEQAAGRRQKGSGLTGKPQAADPVGAYSATGRIRTRRGALAWLSWLMIGLLLLILLAVGLVVRHYAAGDTDNEPSSPSALVITGQPATAQTNALFSLRWTYARFSPTPLKNV